MHNTSHTIITIALYAIFIVGLGLFIYKDVVATMEGFATSNAANVSALCMSCMDYFRDVLQFTDPEKIVPYIKERAEYIMFILYQFKDFVENNLMKCPKKGTTLELSDVTACFPVVIDKYVSDCMKANSASRADCAIISTLGDKLMRKALECGATACTVADFRSRFIQALSGMVQDVEKCRTAFSTSNSDCTKLYSQVILAKTRPADPLDMSLQNMANPTSPTTKEEMRKAMGEATAFMMTTFA